jgi:nitroreductase/NAD-dependent dihydropyrimidine dehydrogenase PreA subunit
MDNMLNFNVNRAKCIRCNACIEDCPRHIIEYCDNYPDIQTQMEEQCIGCQHCLAICPTGAVSIFGLRAEDSLPLEVTPAVAPDALSRFVRGRRTMRQYRSEDVQRPLIDKLLADMAHAPTGGNTCDLTFTVVDKRLALRRILKDLIDGLEKSIAEKPELPEFISKAIYAYRHSNVDEIFRGAPHLLIAAAGEKAYCGDADVVIALSYFELLAQSHKLGTTWCDFLKFILDVRPELGKLFGIATDRPYRAILFGLPAIQYVRTVQRDKMARIRTISS